MFPDKCLGFRLELVDAFIKIVLSAFKPFIGHHQGLFVCVKSVFFSFFFLLFKFFRFFITLQNYVNAKLDKTEIPMTLNKFKTECYHCCNVIKKNLKTSNTLYTCKKNPWWWPMKGSKAPGIILVNSSTDYNLKPSYLSGNLKGS